MTKKSERQKLLDRYDALKAEKGLCDMKFFLGKVSETTVEAVCEDANKVFKLVEEGDCVPVEKWNDSNQPT